MAVDSGLSLFHPLLTDCLVIRVAPQLGKSFANLHCAAFDPDFNSSAARSSCLQCFFSLLRDNFNDLVANPSHPCTNQQARTRGHKKFIELIDYSERIYMDSKQCLIHSNTHLFNILVERLTNGAERSGQVTVRDWGATLSLIHI